MKEYQREYPLLSACGLNCGLCPRYYTEGSSKCPGCAGKGFFTKHPSCGVLSCSRRHGIEYCCLCDEYPCKKYDDADATDSFITHLNQFKDFEKVKTAGLKDYQAELEEKMEILQFLLDRYDDGRRKSFFCLAVNLLELQDLRYVLASLKAETKAGNTSKENAAIAVSLFQTAAGERSITLKLRRKG